VSGSGYQGRQNRVLVVLDTADRVADPDAMVDLVAVLADLRLHTEVRLASFPPEPMQPTQASAIRARAAKRRIPLRCSTCRVGSICAAGSTLRSAPMGRLAGRFPVALHHGPSGILRMSITNPPTSMVGPFP
jgi:hypothetical protein